MSAERTALGRLPPQAIEVEKAVLGAMLIERDCISKVISRIKLPEVFYQEAHQLIFEAIMSLFNQSASVDILTVTQEIRKAGKLESIGGAFYLATLTEQVNSAAHVEQHVMIVFEMFVRRQLIKVNTRNVEKAYDLGEDVFALLDSVQNQTIKLTNVISQRQIQKLGDLVLPAIREIESAMSQPGGVTGVAAGLKSVDTVTGGWQAPNLIIIAARPAMGKTTVVLNMLRNAALAQVPVGIFSLEMSAIELTKKVLSMQSGLTTNQLVKGQVTSEQLHNLQDKSAVLLNAPLFIDETAGITLEQIRAKCVAMHLKHGIRMVVIDYLQLISANGRGSREQEISAISRGLKLIAKDLNIPIIALSQLSRAVEQRTDKRPMLSDLRESGAIEQDADVVCFLYRPAYYDIHEDEEGNNTDNLIEFIIAKHRNGSGATLKLKEELKYSRVHEWDDFVPTANLPEERPNNFPTNYHHFDKKPF